MTDAISRETRRLRADIARACVGWLALVACACGSTESPNGAGGTTPSSTGGGANGGEPSAGGSSMVGSSNGGSGQPSPGGGRDNGVGGGVHAGSGGNVSPSGGVPQNAGGQSAAMGGNPSTGGGASDSGGSAGVSDSGNVPPTVYPELASAAIGTAVRVSGPYGLAESPLWDPCEHRLLFVDVQGGGGKGVINSLGADGMVSVFMSNTGNANGLAFDMDGSLIMAQMGAKHIVRRDKAGNVTQLDPPGTVLHTPDDLIVRSDGTIYFADGDFCPVGNLLGYGSQLPVYTIKPGATAMVNDGVVGGPNGVELSPDERTLYVNAYGEGNVWTFAVAPDGGLTKAARPLITGLAKPDSLCLDIVGNLYIATSYGLQVRRPDGTMIKTIAITSLGSGCLTPGVTNCTFGGDDGKTLYITNWTTLYKVEGMPIPGLDWVRNTKRLSCN